jgi:hypothetical protein
MRETRIRIDDLDPTDGQPELNRFVHLKEEELLAVAGGLLPTEIKVAGTAKVCTATSGGVSEDCWDLYQN